MIKDRIRELFRLPGTGLALLLLYFISFQIEAQVPIAHMNVKVATGIVNLRIISVADAIAAGNGVIEIVLEGGTIGAADLVATDNPSASPVMVMTPYGVRSWRKDIPFAYAYGGSGTDLALSVVKTSDGGFAIGGYTNSWGAGLYDQLLIKTNQDGNISWAGTYGDIQSETGQAARQRTDGGYIILGGSSQGSTHYMYFNFIYADGSPQSHGYFTSSNSNTSGTDVIQCADNEFVAVGSDEIIGAGQSDVLIEKFDINFNVSWGWVYSSPANELANAVIQRPDGGYVVVGNIMSGGDDNVLYCLMNSGGLLESSYSIGGTGSESAEAVTKAADDGYVFTGTTTSFGAGSWDVYLRKQSGDGSGLWNHAIGGTGADFGIDILRTPDGGFAIAGKTTSYGAGGIDLWLIKTDSLGNGQWTWVFGGTGQDAGYSVTQTADGSYLVAGVTNSYGAGNNDVLFVKFANDGSACLGYMVGFNSEMMPAGENSGLEAKRIDNFITTDLPLLQEAIRMNSHKIKGEIISKGPSSRGYVTPTTTVICN